MAEISLQEYLENVETLLNGENYDEVIQHSRHILHYYPKNAVAYRYLGQALLHGDHLDEAADIFRRVLSAYPDDYVAHLGSSEIQERRGSGNEAIWHLERAFEQTPSQAAITDKLRDLYRKYRNTNQDRIQLTSGAVARQYVRSGLHTQAIETLQNALAQTPRRADLRLLLASTLWDSGREMEGAEAALEVLKLLPDCVQANQILTWLWMAEGRPSDAQRYVSRIEAVEPYLAFQVVQGTPPPADAFTLPELDYTSFSQRRLATKRPDWLEDIDQSPPEADWMGMAAGAAAADSLPDEDPALETAMPSDWLTEHTITEDEAPEANDLFGDFTADFEAEAGSDDALPDFALNEPEIPTSTGMTDLLSRLDSAEDEVIEPADLSFLEEEDLPAPDWMASADEAASLSIEQDREQSDWLSTADDFEALANEDEDDLSWLQSTEQDEALNLPSSVDAMDDPLAWLQESGVEFTENPVEDLFAAPSSAGPTRSEEDPLAWLHESGVELTGQESREALPSLDDEAEITFQSPDAADPFAWMKNSGVEMAEADLPDLFADLDEEMGVRERGTGEYLAIEDHADPLAWMHGSGIELNEDEPDEGDDLPALGDDISRAASPAEEAGLDWLHDTSSLDEALDIEELLQTGDLLSGTGALEERDAAPGMFDALAEDEELNFFEAAATAMPPDQDETPVRAAEISFANTSNDTDGQTDMSDSNDLPDWLNSQSSQGDEDGFSWLDEEPTDEAEALEDENALDWMAEIPNEAAEAESFSSMSFEDAPGETGGLDWLNIEDDEPEAEPAQNVPGWLADAAPTGTADEGQFEWLSLEDEDEEAPQAGTAAGWLEGAPISDSDEFEQEAEQIDWTSETEIMGTASDSPDWLAEIAPAAESGMDMPEAEAARAGDLDWLSDDTGEESQTPAWMADSVTEPAAEASGEFEWLSTGEESAEETSAEPVSDTPDWLREVAPAAEFEAEDTSDTGDAGQFEWLSGEGDVEEASTESVSDTPDWLRREITPAAEDTSGAGDAGQFEWLSGEGDEEEAVETGFTWETEESIEEARLVTDTPDWLAEIAPVGEASAEDITSEEAGEGEEASFQWGAESEPDWLADLSSDSEDSEETPETVEDSEVPMWLTDAAPSADDALSWTEDDAEPEITFSTDPAESGFGWIGEHENIEAGIEHQPEAEAEFSGEGAAPYEYDLLEDEPGAYDQNAEIEKELAAAAAPPPAENAPDWLNAMVPGLDLKYEPGSDDVLESEIAEKPQTAASNFNWLTEIVDEETAQVAAVQEMGETPASQTARQGRFSFSRRPAWLRALTERKDEQPTGDQDDFNLPDWLK